VDNVRKLDHPNILKVYEVAEDTSNLYVVTELSEGIKHYGLDGIGIELFDEIHRRITLK
jgi:calcium-dependent protein kinase